MRIAIVTGASSGMGREFVKTIDRLYKTYEIWVIARRVDGLLALAKDVKTHVRPVPLDLTDNGSFEKLRQLLADEKPEVSVLVNASGFGVFGKFTDITLEEQQKMTDLNSRALMSVTYLTLPYMKRGAEIYELGSLSAFQPVPYIGVYAATKAFVLSFSRALNVELKSRGIRVIAVCPDWVRTEFINHAKRDDTITYFNRYFEASEVVARAVRDMKAGRDVSVCGLSIRAQVLLTKLLPHKLVMNIWCRQQKK